MLEYLALPIIVLLAILITYVLAQNSRAPANRLFAVFASNALLQASASLIGATTHFEQAAYLAVLPLGPLQATNSLLLMWLMLALFLPERFAQPITRWLIGLPYIIPTMIVLYDAITGGHFWIIGMQRTTQGTFIPHVFGTFNPLIGALIIGQIVPIVMLICIIVRHPDRRIPAVILASGLLAAFLVAASPQARDFPILYGLGPIPVYLAFLWVTLRYQIFRPSVIALQTAVESLPDGILVLDQQRQVRYANRAAQALLGNPPTLVSQPVAQVLAQAELRAVSEEQQADRTLTRLLREIEPQQVVDMIEVAIKHDRTASQVLVLHDMTLEEQRAAALQAQNIAQRSLLDLVDTLETPAIALADDVLLVPIVGQLDRRRAQSLTTRLLQEAHQRRARIVILELSGVPVVNSDVVQELGLTIQSLRLLGCQVTLSGISATNAATMIQQGVAFDGVSTTRSPQEALESYATLYKR